MFHKILVAMDTSAVSKQVFDAALSLATVNDAKLMLLHVLSEEEVGTPAPLISSLEYYPSLNDRNLELYREQREAAARHGIELLRSRVNRAMAVGVSAEISQITGSPGRAICELARSWGADLIVTGRRGRTGLSELFLGSVSNYVMHHAPCSVLTVQHAVNDNTAAATVNQTEMANS